MAAYAYKYVLGLIPEHIHEKQRQEFESQGQTYKMSCDYDGDLWFAAGDYILELKEQTFTKEERDLMLDALNRVAGQYKDCGGKVYNDCVQLSMKLRNINEMEEENDS